MKYLQKSFSVPVNLGKMTKEAYDIAVGNTKEPTSVNSNK